MPAQLKIHANYGILHHIGIIDKLSFKSALLEFWKGIFITTGMLFTTPNIYRGQMSLWLYEGQLIGKTPWIKWIPQDTLPHGLASL